jgi:hypothetical protein
MGAAGVASRGGIFGGARPHRKGGFGAECVCAVTASFNEPRTRKSPLD